MTYRVEILPAAQRDLAALPLRERRRIDERIGALAGNPRPPGTVALHGRQHGLYRLRVGDYRIVYQVRDEVLLVLIVRVRHRREVYRQR